MPQILPKPRTERTERRDRDKRMKSALEKDPMMFTRELCRRSLFHFMKTMWHEVSADAFIPNWHIEYLCGELEKVAEGVAANEIKKHDLIINIPPGTTKPVWEEMDVLLGDGKYKPLKAVEVGDKVINKYGKSCIVDKVHKQGEQPCIEISTFGGRSLVIALDHPVLTTRGWVNGEDIRIGDRLALMHRQQINTKSSRTMDEFRLAGYFVGDGSVSSRNCAVYGIDPDYLDDLIGCVTRMGFAYRKSIDKNNVTGIHPISKTRDNYGPRQWLRDIGLAGKTSKTKKIPDFVWEGSNEQIISFLVAYFHCDGCVSYRDKGKRNILISMSTVSEELAIGLQRLFLRVGVPMKIRVRRAKNGFVYNRGLKNYTYYTVDTTDQDSAYLFMEKIDIKGYKRAKLINFSPQRKTFDQEYWPDEVKEITALENLPCRCLTVSEGSSFITEGIVVHNTITCSIMFPVWCWTRWPHLRFITASYSSPLALETAEYARDLIRSETFKAIYPNIDIKDDKDTKGNYKITVYDKIEGSRQVRRRPGGNRYSTSVGGTLTGFHGHILIVDDPLNPEQAASDKELEKANRWMSQTLSSRKINKAVTATILIMQRLHQNDPTGNWLAKKKKNVRHICLPGELREYGHKLQPEELREKYEDNLLDPRRMNWSVMDEMLADMGQYGYAGQIGQDPTPPGGGMFKVDNLHITDQMPPKVSIIQTVRYWDKAATVDAGAFTVGVKMHRLKNGTFVVSDVVRGQWGTNTRERIIRQTAELDGRDTVVGVEQEPGSGGKESAEATIRNLAGFSCFSDYAVGKSNVDMTAKEWRADTYSVQVNNGNVALLRGEWNHEYIEELRFFPFGTYADQVDASSGAFKKLTAKKIARRIT